MKTLKTVTIGLVLMLGHSVFAKTALRGPDMNSRTVTIDSRNGGVIQDLYNNSVKKYGTAGGGGYSSAQFYANIPANGNLVENMGHNVYPGGTVQHYVQLNFDFVNNDYDVVTKAGVKVLRVSGNVADALIDIGADEVAGITCARKATSVCKITIR